jgi:hypothetical protein
MEVIEEVIEEVIVCRLFDCRSDIEVRISVSDILGPFYGKLFKAFKGKLFNIPYYALTWRNMRLYCSIWYCMP